MSDQISLLAEAPAPERHDLPVPTRLRWQPLRLGLVELFLYDSEEFWFHDGHLLLRGNNGTGKSKVLSLTLPFLFDAQLRASRIEPDADTGKKMVWNLLMNSLDRRIGYSWIEFGRLDEDGTPHYLTLGAGLSAVAARSDVETWYFLLPPGPEAPRIGRDLGLIADERVLTRERLKDALVGRGQVFEKAEDYRRAVDEHLFGLGMVRYTALMDTLIQLRQPQLSRRPDETALSAALTEALPPLSAGLLADIAEALTQLDEDRAHLEEYQALAKAIGAFEERYRTYAAILSRRQARVLRQAQTEFDTASRELSQAQDALAQAKTKESEAHTLHKEAERSTVRARATLETLRADPTMADANRLAAAEQLAQDRQDEARRAEGAADKARRTLDDERSRTATARTREEEARQSVQAARAACAPLAEAARVAAAYADSPLVDAGLETLAERPSREVEGARAEMEGHLSRRREEISHVRSLIAKRQRAEEALASRREALAEVLESLGTARARRDAADADAEDQGRRLVEDWAAHFSCLRHLRCPADEPLAELVEWVTNAQGLAPPLLALQAAAREAGKQFLVRRHALDQRTAALADERAALEAEQATLDAGDDPPPAAPPCRGADTRQGLAGAPLWQVVDFHDHVPAAERAGLEAALEGAGLLDAWVTPDGALLGSEWLDGQLVVRPPVSGPSLADRLRADGDAVAPAVVDQLLATIACGPEDVSGAEAWISPEGRYRVGPLAGTWEKAQALHIGHAARSAARARRLVEIAARLADLAEEEAAVLEARSALEQDMADADEELRTAPNDQSLRSAQLEAAAAAREFRQAEDRAAQARTAFAAAEAALGDARDVLEWDSADLGLPPTGEALEAVEGALNRFTSAFFGLARAIADWLHAWPSLRDQAAREADADQSLKDAAEALATARLAAEGAEAAWTTLRQAVGARVEDLRQRITDAGTAVKQAEEKERQALENLRAASSAHAVAEANAAHADTTMEHAAEARAQAVARFQGFAASGLLASALPDQEMPDQASPWTIDPALSLARRVEQRLSEEADDDARWKRIQEGLNTDFGDLQRSLSALGHRASADTSDWGMVVHVVYQNRAERPDVLALRLAGEIAQRSELLTTRERVVLENHLQADITTEVQRLLQGAERRVRAINEELEKRPTSTGVRYRLQWQPLGEDEGAPVGLEAARRKLLNTSPDLWTYEDRQVVGRMLQQRIAAERERADAGTEGGALADLLARALDYRRWHRFRVQRYQDGAWRKLSGPASSGERALGLTVPLFAALASFYGQGASPHAPRLILLDEAFAGIDDSARAHCMGLIREFDLDFVLTSEREWACYAELPGVAICQLQRREGIDAVHVSRWTWDGRARRREADPKRQFGSP